MRETIDVRIQAQQAINGFKQLTVASKAFIGVIAAREVIDFGNAIIEATRKFQTYQNQLRLITKDQADLDRTMSLLQQAAVQNRTEFGSLIDLYTKLSVSTQALGISQERVIGVTNKLSQALQVAGADTATANAVIRQFGQAMASGEVRGDEFRSIVEGLGPALAIMAQESGITVGELRKMSQAGELTAEVMFELFENSNALTQAFQSMQPTIAQLETALSDAFDRALVKLGEVTGATTIYEEFIKSLTRTFDRFAGTETALVNLDDVEILKQVNEGAVSAAEAIEEFRERLEDLEQPPGSLFPPLIKDEEGIAYYENVIATLEKLREAEKQRAEQLKQQQAQAKENNEKLNALLNEQVQGLQAAITKGQAYEKLNFGTPLEKARAKLEEAKAAVDKLSRAQEILEQNQELNNNGLKDFTSELEAAKAAVADYQKQIEKLTGVTTETFYENLIIESTKAVNDINNVKEAIFILEEQFKAGKVSVEVYTEAMDRLTTALGDSQQASTELFNSTQAYIDTLKDTTEDVSKELAQINMTPLEKQIDDINRSLDRDMKRAIKEVTDQAGDVDPQEIANSIRRITEATDQARQQQIETAKEVYEQQRSFEYGWKRAYESYADDATNAAKKAERIFQTTTRSMEDSIVNFAKTGKFEFKDLVADIVETLLRSQVQQLISNIFGLGGRSGGGNVLSNLFGGFFANGGTLGAGKFGIAGENGPELITGPATITPLDRMGGGSVTYNINAVDAPSFQQLVARDPGFIHAVASQGASNIPRRR